MCNEGYYGSECESLTNCFGKSSNDPNVCSGKGKCIANDKCVCSDDATGIQCQLPACPVRVTSWWRGEGNKTLEVFLFIIFYRLRKGWIE